MKHFSCRAIMSSVLSEEIEAKTKTEARDIFDAHLENGSVPEIPTSGGIDHIHIEELPPKREKGG